MVADCDWQKPRKTGYPYDVSDIGHGRTDAGRLAESTLLPIHLEMKSRLVLVIYAVLLVVTHGFPADEKSPDDRVGLNRPSTEKPPDVSECGLDALLGEVFGNSGNTNCGGGSAQPNTPNNESKPPVDNYVPDQPQPNPPAPNPSGGEDCSCVQYYLCNDNNTINDNGVGLIDIRLKDEECENYLEKCCGGEFTRPPNDPIIPITSKPPIDAPKCGKRNSEGIGFRITGDNDNEAQYGEFPWMVAVVRPDETLSASGKTVSVYQCGGSLIHPQVVLTASHCVKGKDSLVIRAGEWDTQTKNELYPTQDRKVKTVITHEQYHNGTLANDPALLILESPVDMSVENVGLLCLPEVNENMDNRDCVASGWGKDQFGKEGKYQVILKRVEVPTVAREPCQEALRKTRLGVHFKLNRSFLCAGGQPGKDTCKGDGGSPLACPRKDNPNVYVQAGIVAWGIDCGTETPGVYVNVPFFVDWINNKLQAEGISLNE